MARDIPFSSVQQINKLAQSRSFVLFGAGMIAGKTLRLFEDKNYKCIIDNSENLWNTNEQGLDVFSADKLNDLKDVYILICTTSFAEVSEQLIKLGYEPNADFSVSPILNDLRIIEEIESIEKKLLFSSGAPPKDDLKSGGGVYELNIVRDEWSYKKVISGNCYGIIPYGENFITVDNKRGILEFNREYEVIREAELPLGIRAHGVSYSKEHHKFFIACSYLDALLVLDSEFRVESKIKISDKIDKSKIPQHHCNDCYVIDNSVYVSMFSYSGNWRKEIYDGAVIEYDIATKKEIGPVVQGLSMPHNVMILGGDLIVLDSLAGYIRGGSSKTIGHFPGFTRGLAWDGIYFYIGQSRNRNFSKNLGLSLNTSIDTSVVIFDAETKVSRSIHLPSKVSEIHSIVLL